MLCTVHDLGRLRLREIVATAGIAGRGTHSIATDLAEAGLWTLGHVPRARGDDRTNRHQIRACRHRCQDPASQEPSIGELPDFFASTARTPRVKAVPPRPGPASEPPAAVTSPPPLRAD